MSTYPFSPADYAAARWWNRYLLDYRCHLSTPSQEFSPGTFASMFLRDRGYFFAARAHSLGFGFDRRDDEDLRIPHECWADEEDVCDCYYSPSWSNRLRQYDEIVSLLDQSLLDAGLGRAKICASSVDDGFVPHKKLFVDRIARLELTLGAHTVRAHLSRFAHSYYLINGSWDYVAERPADWVLDVSDRHWRVELDTPARWLSTDEEGLELWQRLLNRLCWMRCGGEIVPDEMLRPLYWGEIVPDEILRAATMAMARGIGRHPRAEFLIYGRRTAHRLPQGLNEENYGYDAPNHVRRQSRGYASAPEGVSQSFQDAAREAARYIASFERSVVVIGKGLTVAEVFARLNRFGADRGLRIETLWKEDHCIDAVAHFQGKRFALAVAECHDEDGPTWAIREMGPLMGQIAIFFSHMDWGGAADGADPENVHERIAPLQALLYLAPTEWEDLVCWYGAPELDNWPWRRGDMPAELNARAREMHGQSGSY